MAYDLSLYYATLDSPSGPLYVPEQETGTGNDHFFRDEDNSPTLGGRIGQLIAYAVMLSFFAYFWFFV